MSTEPKCPLCSCEYAYQDRGLWICPDCAHEWSTSPLMTADTSSDASTSIRDANGNVLQDGDSVTVIKDLKIKGTSSVVKVGTKAKSIRLVESDDGHNIACKIDGVGAMNLKSEFVKKS